ncbi:MAG TPA: DUF5996 family protein [Candidatus Saccharimonadales bacterium]
MSQILPPLNIEKLAPTRDRLQDVALVLSSLQRAFLPKDPRQWQYGLEVTMRGISTQAFMLKGQETRAGIDLVRRKFRLASAAWRLDEYGGPELLNNVRVWLASQGVDNVLEEPKFKGIGQDFVSDQAKVYAEALWWLHKQFRIFKAELSEGVTSPILLYAHHFDLSLVWFPHDDERQLSLGWSTGDKTIPEPYLYFTAYPEPDGFSKLAVPKEAHWQTEGFSALILPYAALAASEEPEKLLRQFAAGSFAATQPLLG